MKFIKVAALAAIVVSGSAMAGMIDQGGWGHGGHDNGPNSTMNIYQYGGGNSAVALQTDARNSSLTIRQSGGGNGADVGQGSDDSTINLTQNGFGNSATLDQWNSKNSTMNVSQYGGLTVPLSTRLHLTQV
jgi:major curlin subunit